MKTRFITLAFLMVVALAFAKENPEPYMTKTFDAVSVKALKVNTSGGSIGVLGKDGEARVEVYVTANNWSGSKADKEEIEERLKDYILTIKQNGEMLICEAKRKEDKGWLGGWKNGLSISFKVFVPEKTTSNLHTSGGSITLKNLSGSQNFGTSGGSLKVSDITGNINGETSGGSITATNCRSNKIDLNTSGGSIKATNCSGDIRLETSGGSITLDANNGKVYASTSGGSIQANLQNIGDAITLSTSGGSIHAQMPLNKPVNLDLSGSRVSVTGLLNNFNGKIEKDFIKGSLNGGGALVSMHTSGGSVVVNE